MLHENVLRLKSTFTRDQCLWTYLVKWFTKWCVVLHFALVHICVGAKLLTREQWMTKPDLKEFPLKDLIDVLQTAFTRMRQYT